MIPLSLELFAWDKENATLTISHKVLSVGNWGGENTISITSHKTGKNYVFKWTKQYKQDNNQRKYWILVPEDLTCPIKAVFMIDGHWPKGRVFHPSKDDTKVI